MRSHFLLLTPAILLAGCLTSQENPNYEYSSRYQAPARIQTAQATPEAISSVPAAPIVYETQPNTHQTQAVTYETQAAPYTGHTTTIAQPIEATSVTAPTDAQYAAQDVSGTPGFMVLAQQSAPEVSQSQTFQPTTAHQPQRVDYDYSQNLIAADVVVDAPEFTDKVRILAPAGQNYTVKQDDTVYALSLKQCVGIDVIRNMNGIGTDYGIQIGQTIRLPASRC